MEDGRDPLQALDVILTGEASTQATCSVYCTAGNIWY